MTQSQPPPHPHLPLLSSLPMLQPYAILLILASKLFYLLFPLPRELFLWTSPCPNPSSHSSFSSLVTLQVSASREIFPNHPSPLFPPPNILNHIFLFHFYGNHQYLQLFICRLYYCLTAPPSPFDNEGRDHT